jgi:hypothetical protein
MSDVTEYGPSAGVRRVAVQIVEADAIVAVELFYARTVAPAPQITTIVYEGNDTSQTEDDLTRIDVVVTCDKQDLASVARIYGKTRVSAPMTGMEWGDWFGDSDEISGAQVGLYYETRFKDESVSPFESRLMRTWFPNGTLKVRQLQNAEYNAKQTLQLHFSFERTTTDILGDALSGVPTDGAYYLQGLVSA